MSSGKFKCCKIFKDPIIFEGIEDGIEKLSSSCDDSLSAKFPVFEKSEISPIVDSKIAAERAPMPLMLIRFLKPSRVSAKDVIFFKFLEAMWPMGQIIFAATHFIGTTFILTYFDDVKLRQRIEKQLNKVELSNKFSKAVLVSRSETK